MTFGAPREDAARPAVTLSRKDATHPNGRVWLLGKDAALAMIFQLYRKIHMTGSFRRSPQKWPTNVEHSRCPLFTSLPACDSASAFGIGRSTLGVGRFLPQHRAVLQFIRACVKSNVVLVTSTFLPLAAVSRRLPPHGWRVSRMAQQVQPHGCWAQPHGWRVSSRGWSV